MIKTGDKYRHEVTYTQEGVIAFAEITGDKNPIHLDPEFAAKTPFGRPIVHGFLSASVFSKVFGMLFPGQGTIYLSQEMGMRKPEARIYQAVLQAEGFTAADAVFFDDNADNIEGANQLGITSILVTGKETIPNYFAKQLC